MFFGLLFLRTKLLSSGNSLSFVFTISKKEDIFFVFLCLSLEERDFSFTIVAIKFKKRSFWSLKGKMTPSNRKKKTQSRVYRFEDKEEK